MSVTIAVSVLVDGEPIDAADLNDAVATLTSAGVWQVDRVGNMLRFTAEDRPTLGDLAEPLFTWWQHQGSGAVLQLLGPAGTQEISYMAPGRAVGMLRQIIETGSGTTEVTEKDNVAPRAPRRNWGSRTHGAFTAQVIGVTDEGGILSIGLAERPDGTGRNLILQGVDPASENAELLSDEEGYCLVTETAATVYGGIKAVTLRHGILRIRLTRTAAKELDLPTTLTIALDVEDQALHDLRNSMRRVFSYGSGHESPPKLDLA